MSDLSRFVTTFTEFSGFTIDADGVPCTAITWSITREQAPIYTMPRPDGKKHNFQRGKRGAAGKLIAKEVLPDEIKLIHIEGDEDWKGQEVRTTADIHMAKLIDGQKVENGYEYTFYTDHGDAPLVIRAEQSDGD